MHRLDGRSFVWCAWDAVGVVTAATRDMLADALGDGAVAPRLMIGDTPGEIAEIAAGRVVSLALWCVEQAADIGATCRAVAAIRQGPHAPVCVCVVAASWLTAEELDDEVGLLIEAGMDLVLCDLAELQRLLPRIVAAAPTSPQGSHPLTCGLLDRLPWRELD